MQTSIPKSPPARLAEDRPNERASANFPHFVAQLEIFHSLPSSYSSFSWAAQFIIPTL